MRTTLCFRVWDKDGDCFLYFNLFLAVNSKGLQEIDNKYIEQHIGIYGRNKKPIFENDILLEIKTEKRYKVIWNERRAGFEMVEIIPKNAESCNKIHRETRYFSNKVLIGFEVIGNIHQRQTKSFFVIKYEMYE